MDQPAPWDRSTKPERCRGIPSRSPLDPRRCTTATMPLRAPERNRGRSRPPRERGVECRGSRAPTQVGGNLFSIFTDQPVTDYAQAKSQQAWRYPLLPLDAQCGRLVAAVGMSRGSCRALTMDALLRGSPQRYLPQHGQPPRRLNPRDAATAHVPPPTQRRETND